jgi:importin subunit beta-1
MANMQSEDEDAIEYMNLLRENILDAYTGILNGFKEDNKQSVVEPYLDALFAFLQNVAMVSHCKISGVMVVVTYSQDPHRDKKVTKALLGVIGDIGTCYGKLVAPFMTQPTIVKLVQQSVQEQDLTETAQWVHQVQVQSDCRFLLLL